MLQRWQLSKLLCSSRCLKYGQRVQYPLSPDPPQLRLVPKGVACILQGSHAAMRPWQRCKVVLTRLAGAVDTVTSTLLARQPHNQGRPVGGCCSSRLVGR